MRSPISASPVTEGDTSATPKARKISPRHRPWTGIALLAALAAVAPWLVDLDSLFAGDSDGLLRYHIDFHVYREGAQALLAGENLYTQDYEVRGAILPFTYPPLAAILFVPLTWLPMMAGAALWTLANVALLWWCLVIVLRRTLTRLADADHRVVATWLLPVALLAEPVRETLSFGQINVLLMTLVLIDTLTRRPWLPRGVCIGLAAAIKLTPAVFLLYFLVRRDWRGAATAVASGVGFTLVAFLLSPGLSLTYWLNTLSDTGRIGGLAYAANQSIQGMLFRLMPDGPVNLVWLFLVVVALAAIVTAMLRVRRAAGSSGEAAAGLVVLNSLVALLCSPVSWSHHWVWLVPLLVVAGTTWWRARSSGDLVLRRMAAGGVLLAAAAVLLAPHWSLPNTQDRELDWSLWLQPWGNMFLVVSVFAVISALLLPRALLALPPEPTTAPAPALRAWTSLQFATAGVLTAGAVLLWLT